VLCPALGTRKIAQVLARAGLHLGATTVRRMLRTPAKPIPASGERRTERVVTAKKPNHVWHVDLTTVPTSLGFWLPWMPWSLPQCWPFCWWVAVAVDHYSRRAMRTAAFPGPPSARQIGGFLGRAARAANTAPKHLITDHGKQFVAKTFRRWCRRHGIRQRFGAIGKYGSLAVVERFIRSLKNECTRRILVPFRLTIFLRELASYADWFNADRPHERFGGGTPDEVYLGHRHAGRRPRFEPRPRWPRTAPCARPHALIRERPGAVVELRVERRGGREHLPVVSLARTA
jgi:transposase InsO family protein